MNAVSQDGNNRSVVCATLAGRRPEIPRSVGIYPEHGANNVQLFQPTMAEART